MKSRRLFACVFIAVLLFFTAQNARLLVEAVDTALHEQEEAGFVPVRDEIQKALLSDRLFMKKRFIDLNGLASKWMGKRVINDTIVLENDMLAFHNEEPYSMEEIADHLTGLHAELEQMGIPLLYVQMPHKLDRDGTLLPEGIQSSANWNADLLLQCLDESGIWRLDLRDGLSRSVEEIERYFFKTDHHWNFDGAFAGFGRIVHELQNALKDTADVSMYVEAENWEKRRLERPFLGSQGIRVGQYVVDLDQIEYYVPTFETDMSCMIHEIETGIHSDFEHALIREKDVNAQKGSYLENAYVIYIGSDYRLVSHRNAQAPVKKKILLIKDSFSLPVQSYMSTIYAEIDVIDKRYFKECSIMEYVLRMKPDAVVMAASPTTFAEAFHYDYGYENRAQIQADMMQHETVLRRQEIHLDDTEASGCMLHAGFQDHTVYTVGFDHTVTSDEENEFLTVSLVEPKSGRHVYSWVFDLGYGRIDERFTWTFRTPQENAEGLELMLFAGQPDETGEKSVFIENIELWKGAI